MAGEQRAGRTQQRAAPLHAPIEQADELAIAGRIRLEGTLREQLVRVAGAADRTAEERGDIGEVLAARHLPDLVDPLEVPCQAVVAPGAPPTMAAQRIVGAIRLASSPVQARDEMAVRGSGG